MRSVVDLLANVYRGELVESIHYGQIAVVDKNGKKIAEAGNSRQITYWRSAAKPFQTLPVIFSGAAEKYGITDEELAVMAASHNGEEEHVRTVQGILDKIGLDEAALLCGIHPPYHEPTARLIYQQGKEPLRLHNNCSGKHAGLLTISKYYGWSLDDYDQPGHPVQRLILKTIAEITGYPEEKILLGVDGCGVVVFGLPLEKMAYAYARLANPDSLPQAYQEAARRITSSMEKYPQMVSGTDTFNTDLMKVTGDKLVAKSGAEGIFCVGVHGQMGVALKIADGNSRAVPPVTMEALSQLGLLDDKELKQLEKYHHPEVINNHQAKVGTIEPTFKLKML